VPPTIDPTDRVAVISYGYWQRRFGGDARILGTEITINSRSVHHRRSDAREFYGLSADTPAEVMMPIATRPQVDAGAFLRRPLNPNGGSER